MQFLAHGQDETVAKKGEDNVVNSGHGPVREYPQSAVTLLQVVCSATTGEKN